MLLDVAGLLLQAQLLKHIPASLLFSSSVLACSSICCSPFFLTLLDTLFNGSFLLYFQPNKYTLLLFFSNSCTLVASSVLSERCSLLFP
ncbi:hypothetical protein LR48_Vigan10g279800 [Vigna angularis]|uniref:Uncharacterized protein n=1 Tax=Phaseolus angularis TaxID=3914 RepID=A0A0L9VPB4_PHAAN|nr:hypothetical protein LR48_Vigan10g279800 [Vigna angularis]